MKLDFNKRKGIGTTDDGVSSVVYSFEYSDVKDINSLPEVFKVKIGENTFNASISDSTRTPITITTDTGIHKFSIGEIDEELVGVLGCDIKLNIFINNNLTGLIRENELLINIET